MQFLARSLSKSIRPSLISTATRQSWVLSQRCHSTFSTGSSSRTRGAEWPRPAEVPYQPKIANSIDLIGYVHQPVQCDSTTDGKFWAGTVISHQPSSDSKSDSDSSTNFWIPLLFEGDLAHTANSYLKKNDRVHITGQILGDVIQSGANSEQAYVQMFKSFHGSFSHQVMVRDLHYIEGSKPLPKALPTLDQNEGVLKHSASVKKVREFGSNRWTDLVDYPNEWFDYRESKQNGSVHPKHPDFKKRDGSEALWLDRAPKEILSELQDVKFDIPNYLKQPKAGEESWKDLVGNMSNWWDNRLNKRNPKAPDFKHKETGVGLWLNDSPSWVLERLPPPKST
ncbi:PREDICTED: protein OSB4, chloroplastic-like [Camelina sativa]|uniref:Protein OSB4, chloroplastic-like n=1 Tax=Camelina sativa TaxID=90675 RepID=A0ABM0WZU3_CAMSA|nr:PREDICTED: protein OSB4, chloroplastic-like [Camelina sativa]